MRNPPGPYKHAGENDLNYSQSADSSLLAKKRQNFAEGGAAASGNPSMDAVKQLVADLKLDEGVNRIKSGGGSGDSGSAFVGGRGGGYGSNVYADDGSQWQSQVPRYDANGMPLRRAINTPFGSIPLAEGGIVKKGE